MPGVGPRTFENVAGFLRVAGAAEPLDATRVHPDDYDAARALLRRADVDEAALITVAARGGGFGAAAAARLRAVGDASDLAGLLGDPCLAGDPRTALAPPPPAVSRKPRTFSVFFSTLEARISVSFGPIRLPLGPLIISARVLEIWTQRLLASTRTKSC